MKYTEDYKRLRAGFRTDIAETIIEGSSVRIFNCPFKSDIDCGYFIQREDSLIPENLEFSYPVFIPGNDQANKAILLLHGLNERSWVKYLVWAFWLCRITGSYVVLFPISFHMNRSSTSWLDPRMMERSLTERNRGHGEIVKSSFANFALSNRLTEDPMRFFNSGYQTFFDIVKLTKQINSGLHPVIPAISRIDIFAYSIGAFLSQIIMMANPGNLFSDSKLFIFCGGSVFSSMKGTSKLIMDSLAYERIYNFYMNDFEETIIKRKGLFSDFLRDTMTGIVFRSMIDFSRFSSFRDKIFLMLREQIHAIALKKDRVIPAEGIVSTLRPGSRNGFSPVEVWDFTYDYSHENPFPVCNNEQSLRVDSCFERLITKAGLFLS